MEKLKYVMAAALIICSLPGWAQTANPATTKPNQTAPQPTNPTTDPALSNDTNLNKATGTTTRTDSVVTTPKEGTSIITAPGTRNKKATTGKSNTTRKKIPKG